MNIYVQRLKKRVKRFLRKRVETYAQFIQRDAGGFIDAVDHGAQAGNDWDNYVRTIKEEVGRNPEGFLREPVISRTVHPSQYELAQSYFIELSNTAFAREKILPRLREPAMGDPYLCPFFPFASTMTMQHAYYLNMAWEYFRVFLPEAPQIKSIIEIGGGYGNMFRLLRDMGYLQSYTIIDLPAMQSLQKHYLSGIFPAEVIGGIKYYTAEQAIQSHSDNATFIFGTFSISEMPLDVRRLLEPLYFRAGYMFFAFNAAFDGVDNQSYFSDLRKMLDPDYSTQLFKDAHRRTWFLLCKSKRQS